MDGSRTAELWVRADVPLGADDRQERLHERATSLAAFADVRTRLVPNRLALSGIATETPVGGELRDALVAARRWAVTADVDLDPYLPVSTESTMVEDRSRRLVTFPSVTLVEYDADGVASVAPHVDGDHVVSVEARLDALADQPEREAVVVES